MQNIVNQENSEKEYDFHHLINTDRYTMDFHSHNYVEIYLGISGGDKFILKDKIYDINPRDLFVVNTFDVHRVITKENMIYERYVLEFKPSFAIPFSTHDSDLLYYVNHHSEDLSDCIPLNDKQFETAMRLIHDYELICNDAYGSDVLQRMKVVEMLTYIARLFYNRDVAHKGIPARRSGDPVTPLLEYINDNFKEVITLDDLAGKLGYNKYYLCKVFKEKTGITINSYITKCRIAYSKKLLLKGIPVTEVCYRSGFHDLSNFIRTFKKETGVPPKKYVNDDLSLGDNSHYYIGPEIREYN